MPVKDYILAEETGGYVTAPEESNIDFRLFVTWSQNVLIDFQKKTSIRAGYTRVGAANTALTDVRNAWTWKTSTGTTLPQRFFDDELEVYLGTVDGVEVNAWTRVRSGWSTTERLRRVFIYDTTENLDFQVMVNGDDNLYRWSGLVTTIASTAATTITKNGTDTWAQARATTAGTTQVQINGTTYTYTGGETTTTLTGVTPDPTGEANDSVVIQTIVTDANKPEANRNNHTIGELNNQIYVGSDVSEEVFVSKNSDYTDFTFSSPRVSGEGALLTLTDPTRGFMPLGQQMLVFSGTSRIFKTKFNQLDVGGVLTETLDIEPLDVGVDQGALVQEAIVPIGNEIFYLTNEVALRAIQDPNNLTGIKPRTFSNPIKPDFDAESWFDSNGKPNAHGFWFKNILLFSAPETSRLYMLNFIQDADGKLKRFWNPPQILPVGAMSVIDSGEGNDLSNGEKLHIHSNAVPETYLAFDGGSDGQYAGMDVNEKLPIDAKAVFAYNNYKKRGRLKNFDEYFVYGEITPNTNDLVLGINYDFDGATQQIEQTIDDFHEIQSIFSTNDVDRFWSVISHGANSTLSKRRSINIKK